MAKKKDKEMTEEEMFSLDIIDEEEPEDQYENKDEELDLPDDEPVMPDIIDDDVPADSMGLAHQISKESETIKNFKELSREVKYSFLDNVEKAEVKHFANAYRDWKYIEKIIDMRINEDDNTSDNRHTLLNINSIDTLKEYFELAGRDYLINDIEDLSPEEIQKLVKHIENLKENKFLKALESKKQNIAELYETYNENNDTPDYIDDMGNISRIMNTSVSSMGHKGNAAKHSVMTIQAVRNEDIQKVAEEKSSFSFLDTFKKKFG